jgi:hypothetical protein
VHFLTPPPPPPQIYNYVQTCSGEMKLRSSDFAAASETAPSVVSPDAKIKSKKQKKQKKTVLMRTHMIGTLDMNSSGSCDIHGFWDEKKALVSSSKRDHEKTFRFTQNSEPIPIVLTASNVDPSDDESIIFDDCNCLGSFRSRTSESDHYQDFPDTMMLRLLKTQQDSEVDNSSIFILFLCLSPPFHNT